MPKSKFPKHLEKDFEETYAKAITRLGKTFLLKLRRAYKESRDITEFNVRINALYEAQLDAVGSTVLLKNVDKEVELISAWSFSQVKKSVINLRGLTQKQVKEGILLNKTDPNYLQVVKRFKATNRELVKTLGKEYISGVSNSAMNTFANGGSMKDLNETMLEYTEGSVSKAKFWARDQVGSAYGEFTKQQQTLAGIQNYVWRTVGDNAVREDHEELNRRVFSWQSGAMSTGLLTKPGATHPGEDYNCRCTAEATTREVTN